MPKALSNRLAVCSWSLHPKSPEELFTYLDQIGIPRLQLALDPLRTDPAAWGHTAELARERGITFVAGMFTTVGEDYTTMESIRKTGGIVPDETWEENWTNIQQIASIAQQLGLKVASFHAGFIPEEEHDPAFQRINERLEKIADLFAGKGIDLGFETGQETAPVLAEFLTQLNRPNVGVNFDPANMVLYEKGDPITALRRLAPWIKQCHLKDAVKTKLSGTWGEEVPVGTGDVNWVEFFKAMDEIGYAGSFSIEREAGNQRVEDIITAKRHVLNLP